MAASLYKVSAGQTAEPLDVNQLEEVLQESPGDTESGGFFIAGPIINNGDVISCYFETLSRVSTPVTCTPTVTSNGGGAAGTATVGHLGAAGFQLYTLSTTAVSHNGFVGGNFVVQF